MSRTKKRIEKHRKSKNIIISLIFLLCIVGFMGVIFNDTKSTKEDVSNVKSAFNSIENSSITLNVVGDIMAHNPQLQAQHDKSTNTYSFDNNFKYVKNYMEKADLSIANLETTLAGPTTPYTSYPTFNTPDALIDSLKYAGVDILSTINNHSFDKGDLGFERTLSIAKEKGFDTVGTVEDVGEKNYIIKDINNIKLGITSFSYGEIKNNTKYLNGIKISDKSKDKMNIFDMTSVDNAFDTINNTLKNIKDTDMKILIIHWGNEYQRSPSEFQKRLAQKLSNSGVDIIIGSHPHVVQPAEIIKSSNGENETLVIYSLGNFISNQRKELLGSPFTEDGLMAEIEITKDFNNKKTFISKANFIPTWVNKYHNGSKYVYEIIPIADKNELSNIDNLPINKIKSSFVNTTSQIKASNILTIPKNPFE